MPSGARCVAETFCLFCGLFACPSTGSAQPLFARAALFPTLVVLIRGWVSLRRVRVVLALVVFLSGALGHLWFPFLSSLIRKRARPPSGAWTVASLKESCCG